MCISPLHSSISGDGVLSELQSSPWSKARCQHHRVDSLLTRQGRPETKGDHREPPLPSSRSARSKTHQRHQDTVHPCRGGPGHDIRYPPPVSPRGRHRRHFIPGQRCRSRAGHGCGAAGQATRGSRSLHQSPVCVASTRRLPPSWSVRTARNSPMM